MSLTKSNTPIQFSKHFSFYKRSLQENSSQSELLIQQNPQKQSLKIGQYDFNKQVLCILKIYLLSSKPLRGYFLREQLSDDEIHKKIQFQQKTKELLDKQINEKKESQSYQPNEKKENPKQKFKTSFNDNEINLIKYQSHKKHITTSPNNNEEIMKSINLEHINKMIKENMQLKNDLIEKQRKISQLIKINQQPQNDKQKNPVKLPKLNGQMKSQYKMIQLNNQKQQPDQEFTLHLKQRLKSTEDINFNEFSTNIRDHTQESKKLRQSQPEDLTQINNFTFSSKMTSELISKNKKLGRDRFRKEFSQESLRKRFFI